MPILNLKIIQGKGFNDIAPSAGCCGKQKKSRPQAFFTIGSADTCWRCEPMNLQPDGRVGWNKVFNTINSREPESDRLHIAVVDGSFWSPSTTGQVKQDMSRIPRRHFYGEIEMSVIQFERMKKEKQWLTLKGRDGKGNRSGDTGYMIEVEGYFEDDNIDDDRINVHAGGHIGADGQARPEGHTSGYQQPQGNPYPAAAPAYPAGNPYPAQQPYVQQQYQEQQPYQQQQPYPVEYQPPADGEC